MVHAGVEALSLGAAVEGLVGLWVLVDATAHAVVLKHQSLDL